MNSVSLAFSEIRRASQVQKNANVRVDVLGSTPASREAWLHAVDRCYGMLSAVDPECPPDAKSTGWYTGELGMVEADVAHQVGTPVPESHDSWAGENLWIKMVTNGSIGISQRGESKILTAGSICLVDPAWHFEEFFWDRAQVLAVQVPKASLRDRGFRSVLNQPIFSDMSNPDIVAVRDFFSFIAQQRRGPSEIVRQRLGQQFLDLMDVLTFDQPAPKSLGRSTAATLLRAKRVIARRLGDSELSVAEIAAELHISENHLARLFRADGQTVMRCVISQRLELASRILAGLGRTGIQMQEVAFRCGFVSAAHFSRVFKERYGHSPKQAANADVA
jgi:AraC-like DNA-binding protein